MTQQQQQMLFDGISSQASPVKRIKPVDHGMRSKAENFEAIQGTLSESQQAVLRWYAQAQWLGATREEIAERSGIKLSTICGRTNDLKKMGLVIETEKRRRTASGKTAVIVYHWKYQA